MVTKLLSDLWSFLPDSIKEDLRRFVIAQVLNTGALATTLVWSLDGIWRILQIVLVLISIGYTLTLWYKVRVELRKLKNAKS
jgi:hypothetical protein